VRKNMPLMLDGREVEWAPRPGSPQEWILVYRDDPGSPITHILRVGSGWQILAVTPGATGRGSFSDPDDAKFVAERDLRVVRTP
jgi:hypothetical protein